MLDSVNQWHWYRSSLEVWNCLLQHHQCLYHRRTARPHPFLLGLLSSSFRCRACCDRTYLSSWQLRLVRSRNRSALRPSLIHLHWMGRTHRRSDRQLKHFAEILQVISLPCYLSAASSRSQWKFHLDSIATKVFEPLSDWACQDHLVVHNSSILRVVMTSFAHWKCDQWWFLSELMP